MNESQFGDKIRHILNQGLSLDSRKAARLQAARELALARKRPEPVGVLASAGVWAGNMAGDFGGWGDSGDTGSSGGDSGGWGDSGDSGSWGGDSGGGDWGGDSGGGDWGGGGGDGW